MHAGNHSGGGVARGWLAATLLVFWSISWTGAISAEPRMLSHDEHGAWQAIGRVNQAGFSSRSLCTGTLIAPDVVLTAAHCFDVNSIDPVIFVAGWYLSGYKAARKVVRISQAPLRARPPDLTLASIAQDWAFLHLESPITGVIPLQLARPPAEAEVDLIAYSGTRPNALERQSSCKSALAGKDPSRVLAINCPSVRGNSGGPVLMREGRTWRVIGVVSAAMRGGGTLAAIPDR